MRKIIAYLTEDERRRYVANYAKTQLVLGGSPHVSVDDAVQIVQDDQDFYRKIRNNYEIPEDETIDIALYDGAILDAEE